MPEVLRRLHRSYLQSLGLLGLVLAVDMGLRMAMLLLLPKQTLSLSALFVNSSLGGLYAALLVILLPACLVQAYREWFLTRSLPEPQLMHLIWRAFWPWWLGLSALSLLFSSLPLWSPMAKHLSLSTLSWPLSLGLSGLSLGCMVLLAYPPQWSNWLRHFQQAPLERFLFWLLQPLQAHSAPTQNIFWRSLSSQVRPLQAGLLLLMLPLLVWLSAQLLALPTDTLLELKSAKGLDLSQLSLNQQLQSLLISGWLGALLLSSLPGSLFWRSQAEFYLTRPLPGFKTLNLIWQSLLALLPLAWLGIALSLIQLPLQTSALLALGGFVLLAGGLAWPLLLLLLLSLQTPAILGSLLVLLLHSGWISLALWGLLGTYRLFLLITAWHQPHWQGLPALKRQAISLLGFALPLLALATIGLQSHPLLRLLHLESYRQPALNFWHSDLQVQLAAKVQTLLVQGPERSAYLQENHSWLPDYQGQSLQGMVATPHAPATQLSLSIQSLEEPLNRTIGRFVVCRSYSVEQPVGCQLQTGPETLKAIQIDYPLEFMLADYWAQPGIDSTLLNPEEAAKLAIYQSLKALHTGDSESALQLAETALKHSVSESGFLYLAGVQRLLGQYDAALATYDRWESTSRTAFSPQDHHQLKALRQLTQRSAKGQ